MDEGFPGLGLDVPVYERLLGALGIIQPDKVPGANWKPLGTNLTERKGLLSSDSAGNTGVQHVFLVGIPSGVSAVQLNKAGTASQLNGRCPGQVPSLAQLLSPTVLSDSFLLLKR